LEDQGRGQKGPSAAEEQQKLLKLRAERERFKGASEKEMYLRDVKEANELLSRASSMLKPGEKIDNKQAVELLERALKQLKEQEKRNVPGEGTPDKR